MLTRTRACEQLQKFCEHEQASTCVIFASNLRIGQIFASTFKLNGTIRYTSSGDRHHKMGEGSQQLSVKGTNLEHKHSLYIPPPTPKKGFMDYIFG